MTIWLKKLLIFSILPFFFAGVSSAENDSAESPDVGFLIMGDTGYHLSYLSPDDYYRRAKTEQQSQANFFHRWVKGNRSFSEFKFPLFTYVPEIGGYVEASGLYPTVSGMSAFCETSPCHFGIMLGDNIYNSGATLGADYRDDNERFNAMFELPFAGLGRNEKDFRIYVTLGNHDWGTSREGALLQAEYHENHPRFYMDGFFYTVKPPVAKGEVEIFVVDSQILLNSEPVYRVEVDEQGFSQKTNNERERKPHHKPANPAEKNMVQWLERALKKSTAKWKFIIAHHPMWSFSSTKATDDAVMQKLLRPVACRYADAYFAGHEHTLGIVEDSCHSVKKMSKDMPPMLHVVSGAVAKLRPISGKYMAAQAVQYPQRKDIWVKSMEFGFAQMTVSGDDAMLKMLTVPYSGARGMETAFEYKVTRRSHLAR